MDPWLQALVVSSTSILASSGFWAFVQRKDNVKTATAKLLLGLAYEKITHLGMKYIERGWISKDEYSDFQTYLYDPYKSLGGNGVAERIMEEVANLPIKSRSRYFESIRSNRKEDE